MSKNIAFWEVHVSSMGGKSEYKWFWTKLNGYLEQHGLRQSKMRHEIIAHFLKIGGHINAQTLHGSLTHSGVNVGIATVFRALKLLDEAGLAEQSGLGGDAAAFEVITPRKHHDHLVCNGCGKVVEFHDRHLEDMKTKIALQHEFTLQSHRLVLYGICKKCACHPAIAP